MSRNNFQEACNRAAQEVLPPHLSILDFNGVVLHPRFKTEAEGGGWDNSTTIFGLTIPAAHGRSLIVQVSPKTEKLLAKNSPEVVEFLKADLRRAASMWDEHSVRHEEAREKTVKL